MRRCPTMPEPLPNRHRSPIVITGSDTIDCPGTMPADRVICGPNIVPEPMWMYCSLNSAFGGKQMTLCSPNAPKRRPRRVVGPIAPSSTTSLPPRLDDLGGRPLGTDPTTRWRSRVRHLGSIEHAGHRRTFRSPTPSLGPMTAPPPLGSITDVPGVSVGHHQRTGPRVADRHDGGPRSRWSDPRRRRPRRRSGHAGDRRARAREPGRAHPRRVSHRRERLRARRRPRGDDVARDSRALGFPIGRRRCRRRPRRRARRAGRRHLRSRTGRHVRQPSRRVTSASGPSLRPVSTSDAGARSVPAPGAKAGGLQGGVGTASTVVRIPGVDGAPPIDVVVGALAVVNANGSIVDPSSGSAVGTERADPPPARRGPSVRRCCRSSTARLHRRTRPGSLNTTIGVVATSAALVEGRGRQARLGRPRRNGTGDSPGALDVRRRHDLRAGDRRTSS